MSMTSSLTPRSRWSSGAKSNCGGSPTWRSTTASSSPPSGTSSSRMLGICSSSALRRSSASASCCSNVFELAAQLLHGGDLVGGFAAGALELSDLVADHVAPARRSSTSSSGAGGPLPPPGLVQRRRAAASPQRLAYHVRVGAHQFDVEHRLSCAAVAPIVSEPAWRGEGRAETARGGRPRQEARRRRQGGFRFSMTIISGRSKAGAGRSRGPCRGAWRASRGPAPAPADAPRCG